MYASQIHDANERHKGKGIYHVNSSRSVGQHHAVNYCNTSTTTEGVLVLAVITRSIRMELHHKNVFTSMEAGIVQGPLCGPHENHIRSTQLHSAHIVPVLTTTLMSPKPIPRPVEHHNKNIWTLASQVSKPPLTYFEQHAQLLAIAQSILTSHMYHNVLSLYEQIRALGLFRPTWESFPPTERSKQQDLWCLKTAVVNP